MSNGFRILIFPISLLFLFGASVFLQPIVGPVILPALTTVVAFFLVIMLERSFPRVRRNAEPNELRADIAYAGMTALFSDPIAHALVAGAVVMSASDGLAVGLPLWLGTIGVLFVGGLGDYWAHRFSHQWPWWWKLHAVHHAPHRMVALNNLRLHPLDLGLKVLFAAGPVLLLGFQAEAIAIAAALRGVVVAFQHANLDLRHGPLNFLFATNSVHRWHHSARREEADSNYGGVLSVFDLAFGTYQVPAEYDEPLDMGLYAEGTYPIHEVVRSAVAPFCWARCVEKPPLMNEESNE